MTGSKSQKPVFSPDVGDIAGEREQAVARRLAGLSAATPTNEELRRSLRDELLAEPAGRAAHQGHIVSRPAISLRPRVVYAMIALSVVAVALTLALQPPTIATARAVEAIGSVELLRLTAYDGFLSAFPAGSRVVVEKDEGLWLLSPDGTLTSLFDPPAGNYARMPAVSPDGTRVAFSHSTESGVGISVIGLDGTEGPVRITTPGPDAIYDLEPAWSPDGRRIAFTRSVLVGMRPVVTRDSIMITNADASGHPTELAEGTHPTWSPAGDRIVFSRRTGDSGTETELFIAHLDGSKTTSLGQGSEPAWSPAGQFIAYVKTEARDRILKTRPDGTPWLVVQEWSRELWALNVVSGERFHLTTSTPTPRFDLVEWQREAEAAGPPPSGEMVAVVEGDHNDWDPAWAKDGRAIVFIRSEQPAWSSAGGFSVQKLILKLR